MPRPRLAGLHRLAAVALPVATALAIAPAAVTAADFAYLTSSQLTQLRALPLPLVLPRTLPAGYRLAHFEAVRDVVKNGLHSAPANEYDLTFRNGAGRELNFRVADSAWGDPAPDTDAYHRPFVVQSPVLGSTTFEPSRNASQWSWLSGYVTVDARNPKARMNVGGSNPADVTAFYRSFERLSK